MAKSDHGIGLDKKDQEQPMDKDRAQDSSSKNIPGHGPQSEIQRRQTDDGQPRPTEDDIQRDQLGPRGVPGRPDPAKMTPQREKKTPKHIDPGHTS
jgi:hypothetical protein